MSIPEFILKKLIVPGSFKTHPKGFSFAILNSFASATVTRFHIFVADHQIPDDQITLSSANNLSLICSEISPETPMILAVGSEFLVTVNDYPPIGAIQLIANTKEVGELAFSLSEGSSKKKTSALKPSTLQFLQKSRFSKLTIDGDQKIGKASPFIFGQFIEHLEKCVYDGVWTADGSKLREDTLDLIRQLNPPLIRYPGGNFASGYHWEDGIGPKENRPSRHDAAWQSEESNQVGTDEFLSLCEQLNAEPCLVVNDGSGTPEEAARWVAYCNSPVDTEQGARRAKNGHPQPYHVKYWGLGNEVWGPWQIGTVSSEEYVKRASRFIKAMREVDPEIKIVAVGNNPLTDSPDDPATAWNRTVLENLAPQIDYLSWHIYQPEKSGWKESYDALDLFHAVCAAPIDIEWIIRRVERQIQEFSPGRQILQAVDEWNLWLPPREKNVSMHHVTYTMRDALYTSSVLITFLKNCHTVGMANLAQLVNVLPMIQTNQNAAIATSIFYPFILFSELQDNIINSTVVSECFNSQYVDINMVAHDHVPYLDAVATCNDENSKISVILVNRYPFHRLKVSMHLKSFKDLKPAHALQIHASTPEVYNTFRKPDAIRISDAKLPALKENCWEVTLKPCSIYFVEFQN